MKAKSKRLKFVSILMAFVIGATSITAFSAAEDANGITEITENTEIDTSETEEISKEAQEQTSNISEDDSKISDVQEDQDMPEELDVQKEQDALEEPGAQKDTTPDMAEESDSYSDRDVDADMSEVSDSQENSTQYTTEELDFAEIQKDWTMKATLLDSSVDGGNTELKSIDWDASDGGFLEGSGRNITLRISWQKFPGKENYERNSIRIYVPKPPLYWNYRGFESSQITEKFLKINEQLAHSGWGLRTAEENNKEYYVFYNNETINSYQSKEGHIDIIMSMTPMGEEISNEHVENSCEVSANHVFDAQMYCYDQEIHNADDMPFSYRRTYIHEWKKEPNKLAVSFFGINANFEQNTKYIKYDFSTNAKSNYYFPEYDRDLYIETEFPSDQKVYFNNVLIQPYEGNKYRIPIDSKCSIAVGYPGDIYNEANNNEAIKQVFNLYHEYKDGSTYLGEDVIVNFNLANYNFTYDGDLYGISYQHDKRSLSDFTDDRDYLYISDKIDLQMTSYEKGQLNMTAKYTNFPMDIIFGTDYFAITDQNGNYRPLDESERKIRWIQWFQPQGTVGYLKNTYDVELYVKYINTDDYVLRATFSSNESPSWFFLNEITSGKNIVSFYFKMKGVTETVQWAPAKMSWIPAPEEGTYAANGNVYTSDYIKVYNGETLENVTELSNYNTLITKNDIAQHDLNEHGCYIQRGGYSTDYRELEVKSQQNTFKVNDLITEVPGKINNKQFVGGKIQLQLTGNTGSLTPVDIRAYGKNIPKEQLIRGYKIYTLLPYGIKLDESETKYVRTQTFDYSNTDSAVVNKCYPRIFEPDGSTYKYSNKLLEEGTTYEAIDNWNETGRQLVVLTIDLGKDMFVYSPQGEPFFKYQLGFNIDLGAYIKSGGSWDIRSYGEFLDREATNGLNDTFHLDDSDDGKYDSQEADINGNNKTDVMAMDTVNLTITAPSDSMQEVSTWVIENDTELFESSVNPGETYEYRFKVSTGNNMATNIILYTSIEDQIKNNQGQFVSAGSDWRGSLLDINVSQIRELGLFEKIYWSESNTPGNIGEDSSWKEYTDATDKTKIKSLAIKIVDENGNPAVIPGLIELSAGIIMKSPERYAAGQAHIACWTGWNNINSLGQVETTVSGMPSNTVSVSLKKPEMKYIEIQKTLTAYDEDERDDDMAPMAFINDAIGIIGGNGRSAENQLFMFVFENEQGESFNIPVMSNNSKRFPIKLGEYTLKEIAFPGYVMTNAFLMGKYDGMYEAIELDEGSIKIDTNSKYSEFVIYIDNYKYHKGYSKDYNVSNYFKV